jgi:peptide/nickel transport system substrate-binding protein
LREGVKWHDGKPFTAADVKCTWDMLIGSSGANLRLNPRKAWYRNLEQVTTDGDYSVGFELKRPQPSLLALLASAFSPVYSCHVPPRDVRQHPIGTGPFNFVEFKPNESIKLTRNANYWKKDRPYLDGVEYTIIPDRSTAILAFMAGKFDMIFPYQVSAPLLKDIKSQAPETVCETRPVNARDLLVNRDKPPFDKSELRRAMAVTSVRRAGGRHERRKSPGSMTPSAPRWTRESFRMVCAGRIIFAFRGRRHEWRWRRSGRRRWWPTEHLPVEIGDAVGGG